MRQYRYYQQEADDAIYKELMINDKCLVKMFCGTGKSEIMRKCKILQNKKLVVYVFPSLSLIDQFYKSYLYDVDIAFKLRISSDSELSSSDSEIPSTTNPMIIKDFISKNANKIVCVTYQSYKTLIDNLNGTPINCCVYDESHHAVGQTYQKIIFENTCCQKQIFFTATPKNANGIIMYDRNKDENMCGRLVYDYSYLRGVFEDYLNPFEIRIDLFTENTNKMLFESIARTILTTGNNRILTFHADVNAERDTSVNLFVNVKEFIKAFQTVKRSEFPTINKYNIKNIKMVGLSSSINMTERKNLLAQFDETPDNHIFIISSCETIGEGIDTKNANMCVFVDPKSSYVKIIQNIGRIVRKPLGKLNAPNSTVLIPCWVDKTKYIECDGDKDKCDAVIRQDMNEGENFNGILNVLSALRQEDEDIYDICLYYPDTFSPQEIKSNLEKQGFTINEPVGDGGIVETCEHLLDQELDYEDFEECENEQDIVMKIAEDNDVCVEIHANSLENPIERYNPDGKETIRLYKCEKDDDTEDTPVYQPIVKKDGVKKSPKSDQINAPNRHKRSQIKVHTNPDVKVLWKISSDIDLVKDMCSCVIDCEIVDTWFERFEELKSFIDENKRKPIKERREENEKKLGRWLYNQMHNYRKKLQGMKNEHRYNLWTNFLEEYKDYLTTNNEKWEVNFIKLKAFINENKRVPVAEKNEYIEKTLGYWIRSQKSNYKNKKRIMKDELIYNKWTEFVEEYNEYFVSNDEKWNDILIKLKAFINKTERMPSKGSKNKEEKYLGHWLRHQMENYKDKKEGMINKDRYELWSNFLEEYQEYFVSNEELWENKFSELKKFINLNYRLPSQTKSTEKLLSKWMGHQQYNYKSKNRNMKNKIIYDKWSEFLEEYKEYFIRNEENWKKNMDDLKKFINEHNRRPNKRSNDVDEKKLGNWLTTQQQKYIKKVMNDEKHYDIWSVFIENYKVYLTDKRIFNKKEDEDEEEIIIIPKKKSMKLTKPKKVLEKQFKETPEERRQRNKSELSVLHQRYKTMTSNNLHNAFKQDIELWHNYHKIAEENEKSFPDEGIPRNRIIQELDKIKTKRRKLIVDMGCGKAQIAEHFKHDNRFEFINYDHIAINDNVTECDISNVPLEDDSVELCILSLAMWGSNCSEYIKEAKRILESNGNLYIIEPTKRWTCEDEILGKRLNDLLVSNGFKIVEESIEKFALFICVKL